VKYHHVKCRSMRAAEKLKVGNVTNGIKANLYPNMVWFKDELGKSWWTCNTSIESHHNEKDPEFVQV